MNCGGGNPLIASSREKCKPKIALILQWFLECFGVSWYRTNRKNKFFRIEFMEDLETGDRQLCRHPLATNGPNPGAHKTPSAWSTYRAAAKLMKVTFENELADFSSASSPWFAVVASM
jgi:hypothetical protein